MMKFWSIPLPFQQGVVHQGGLGRKDDLNNAPMGHMDEEPIHGWIGKKNAFNVARIHKQG